MTPIKLLEAELYKLQIRMSSLKHAETLPMDRVSIVNIKSNITKIDDLIIQYKNALKDLPDRSYPDSEGGL